MLDKFNARVDRLADKIGKSATPVPGLIVGLSGTDSILAFLMCFEAMRKHGIAHRLYGVHYAHAQRRKQTWFEGEIIPWLHTRCPETRLEVQTPLGGNYDQCRWADLHMRALNDFLNYSDVAGPMISSVGEGQGYWVVGTINATERALGTYSVLADTASIQPLHTLSKSTILALCAELGVPKIALEMARQPDCFCGRDELASSYIELIDDILNYDVDLFKTPPAVLDSLYAYVRQQKHDYGFKQRLPYTL